MIVHCIVQTESDVSLVPYFVQRIPEREVMSQKLCNALLKFFA